MPDIRRTLERLNEEERKKFFNTRNAMRKAYLMSICATVGINGYNIEDDNFMDAIDLKIEMLMFRAGMDTPNANNRNATGEPEDVFARVLRPNVLTKETGDKIVAELEKTVMPTNVHNWDTPMNEKVG